MGVYVYVCARERERDDKTYRKWEKNKRRDIEKEIERPRECKQGDFEEKM
jgi:hypothetical protein